MGSVVILVDFSLTKKIKLLFQRSITLFSEMLLELSTMALTMQVVSTTVGHQYSSALFLLFSKQFEHITTNTYWHSFQAVVLLVTAIPQFRKIRPFSALQCDWVWCYLWCFPHLKSPVCFFYSDSVLKHIASAFIYKGHTSTTLTHFMELC